MLTIYSDTVHWSGITPIFYLVTDLNLITEFDFLYARLQTGRIMVWWCPSVRPSGSPSIRPSIRPSVRPSQFSALFSYMLWHIDLKFCVSLYFYARKIKFKCHQFPSIFAGVMLLFNFKLFQICSFPHFSPTCFDILSSNFVYDFVFMYHRSSLSVVILHQFLYELCLFVNIEYSKYTVFRAFLLHVCFDILSWNFAYDFVLLYYRSTSRVVNLRQFLWELCPFWNLEYWKYTVFRTFLLHPLTVLSWTFACYFVYFYARKIKFKCHQFPSIFAGVMLLFNFKLFQICSFPHFSPTCFDILSSNFVYDFVFMYHRSSLSVVILHQFLYELCLFVNIEYSKYTVFRAFLLHVCFDILSWNFAYDFVLLYYRSTSRVVNLRQFLWELCPFWNLEYWKYTVFRTFLLHPLTVLSWKFAYYFVFLYYRSSLSVVNLRLFWSYASFRT